MRLLASFWRWLNARRWYSRAPIKLILFVLGVGLVLFPKVWLLPRVAARCADLESLLDPQHPELDHLASRVRSELTPQAKPGEALTVVERVVSERIPYAWDWEVWGVAEYLPTVTEVFARGREDCDGRAVVAASLLRRLGYDAWVVSDLLHMWVATPYGETMSPTGGDKTLVATKAGTRARLSWGLLENLARGFSYGVAVFPALRELIILALLVVLTVRPGVSRWQAAAGCVLLLIALDAVRHAGRSAALLAGPRDTATVGLGLAIALVGWLLLAVRRAGPHARCPAAPPR